MYVIAFADFGNNTIFARNYHLHIFLFVYLRLEEDP